MADAPRLADPERQLALAYVRGARRAAIVALWLLDERMGAIVAGTREPMIGQMRLMWWRDALIALDDPAAAVPGEPLLAALAQACASYDISGERLAQIEEGWGALLDGEVPDEAAILTHGRCRGALLFEMSAVILGGLAEGVAPAGEAWALADLGHRLRSQHSRAFARRRAASCLSEVSIAAWPARLRPLGILAMLARRDAALPPERQRRQGSPSRVLRALTYGFLGR